MPNNKGILQHKYTHVIEFQNIKITELFKVRFLMLSSYRDNDNKFKWKKSC